MVRLLMLDAEALPTIAGSGHTQFRSQSRTLVSNAHPSRILDLKIYPKSVIRSLLPAGKMPAATLMVVWRPRRPTCCGDENNSKRKRSRMIRSDLPQRRIQPHGTTPANIPSSFREVASPYLAFSQ